MAHGVTQSVMDWVNKAIDTYERLAESNPVQLAIESDEMLFTVANYTLPGYNMCGYSLWIENQATEEEIVDKSLDSTESIEDWFAQHKFVPNVVQIVVIDPETGMTITLKL